MCHISKHNNLPTPIFVIGAMKAGTTTLSKYLLQSPEICFAHGKKEPEYFSKTMGREEYKTGEFWDLFNLNERHRFVCDASVGYSKYPSEKGVPKRIFEYGLKPKFIYIVRNPFDRIESHFNFMKKYHNWKLEITSIHLTDTSNYYKQINQYLNYFTKEDIMILDFDDLTYHPERVLNQISKFIGTYSNIEIEHALHSNKTKIVNRNEEVLKVKYYKYISFLPKSTIKQMSKFFSLFFRKKYTRLTHGQKQKIHKLLVSDMKKLKTEFGFPVEKWGFN